METIMEDINSLVEKVRDTGEKVPEDIQRIVLAEHIAYLTYELRRKYKLTSDVYLIAEGKAIKTYENKYGENV